MVGDHEDFGCADCFGGDDGKPTEEDEEELENVNLFDGILIFNQVKDILTNIEIILQILETGIHGNELVEMWVDKKYYSAGYHLGSGGLGIAVLIDDVVR